MAETEVWGWERFFDEIKAFVETAQHHFGTANENYAHYVTERFEMCVATLRQLKQFLSDVSARSESSEDDQRVFASYQSQVSDLLVCIELLSLHWHQYVDHLHETEAPQAYIAPNIQSTISQRGRPRLEITRDQLQYLSSLSFSWTHIANILGVSRMTIYRRRLEFDMVNEAVRSPSDDELRRELNEMRQQHPDYGESMSFGHLRSKGYHVTRHRLRRLIRETDPINTALRWTGGLTARRPYSVPGPNSLWHIGNSVTHSINEKSLSAVTNL